MGKGGGATVAALALLFANQMLAGFPKRPISAGGTLVALFRAFSLDDSRRSKKAAAACRTGALALGALAGAVVLLPPPSLRCVDGRVVGYDFATYPNFWPPLVFSFFGSTSTVMVRRAHRHAPVLENYG